MVQRHTLLVVDDEVDVVQSLQDLLRGEYRVLGATRAREGLRLLHEQPVHVIMTDQRMPEISGIDFLHRVRDNGIGIAREQLPHLFEPFFTEVDVSRHSSGQLEFGRRGLGLGLSVVRAFVAMHGGTVDAASTPGQGTTITITLPASTFHQPAAPARDALAGAAGW